MWNWLQRTLDTTNFFHYHEKFVVMVVVQCRNYLPTFFVPRFKCWQWYHTHKPRKRDGAAALTVNHSSLLIRKISWGRTLWNALLQALISRGLGFSSLRNICDRADKACAVFSPRANNTYSLLQLWDRDAPTCHSWGE